MEFLHDYKNGYVLEWGKCVLYILPEAKAYILSASRSNPATVRVYASGMG